MHINAEDRQQASDNCKYRNDLPDFLNHESASAVTKSLRRGTRLSRHIDTKIVFQRWKYWDLGCPLKGQGYIPSFKILNYFYSKTNKMHNFSNLFWNNTLHVSDGHSVRQESKTVHTCRVLFQDKFQKLCILLVLL